MHMKHLKPILTTALALILLLTACSSQQPEETPDESAPFTVTVCAGETQDTLDPAASTAEGGETILFHLFENLMRWVDDGSGHAVLAPGQAESYEVETDYAGNATYTFTLRDGIRWSDGQAVTASDFVTAWQRLADPANELPHRALLADISGYSDVQSSGDPTLLGVSAPDDQTLVVKLTGSCAYFLEEICASAYTMPVRQDLVESGKWGSKDTATNGAYHVSSLSNDQAVLERSETYYDSDAVGPDSLCFTPASGTQGEYDAFLNGETDLIVDLPEDTLQTLTDSGSWLPDPVTTTYGLLLNTRTEPFTDANVRLALRLAIDTQAITEAAGDLTLRSASGLLPYGITDYGRTAEENNTASSEADQPISNAAEEPQEPDTFWDFRAHSLEKVTVPVENDYETNCRQAQSLLAQAGYPNGTGFPTTEYIYVASDSGKAIAEAVTSMWKKVLGITVNAKALTQEEYTAMLTATEDTNSSQSSGSTAPAFQIAAQDFTAAYSDAKAILKDFFSTNAGNLSGYDSDAFDILMKSAAAAVSPEARDAYLHDAEAILLNDVPVIPLCYKGLSWQLREGLSGLYRAPDGVFFLSALGTNGNAA